MTPAERIARALVDGSVSDPEWQVYPREATMTAQQTRLDRLVRALRRADEGDRRAKIEAKALLFERPAYDCRKYLPEPAKRLGPWGWALLILVWTLLLIVKF